MLVLQSTAPPDLDMHIHPAKPHLRHRSQTQATARNGANLSPNVTPSSSSHNPNDLLLVLLKLQHMLCNFCFLILDLRCSTITSGTTRSSRRKHASTQAHAQTRGECARARASFAKTSVGACATRRLAGSRACFAERFAHKNRESGRAHTGPHLRLELLAFLLPEFVLVVQVGHLILQLCV